MDCLIWFSELPQVGGRILSRLISLSFAESRYFLGGKGSGLAILVVVLESHSREVLWVSEFLQGIWMEADPYLVEKGLCDEGSEPAVPWPELFGQTGQKHWSSQC